MNGLIMHEYAALHLEDVLEEKKRVGEEEGLEEGLEEKENE